ncbi:hypothetical protein KUF71_002677, partial [Frankliniella fusca]
PTDQQWMRLMDVVKANRGMQGEFMGPGAAGRVQSKWEELAAQLNGMGGAFKIGDKWKEAFANFKSRAKRQYQERVRYMGATGGGPHPPDQLGLRPVYQRALSFIPPESLRGNVIPNALEVAQRNVGGGRNAQQLQPIMGNAQQLQPNIAQQLQPNIAQQLQPNIAQQLQPNMGNAQHFQHNVGNAQQFQHNVGNAQQFQHNVGNAQQLQHNVGNAQQIRGNVQLQPNVNAQQLQPNVDAQQLQPNIVNAQQLQPNIVNAQQLHQVLGVFTQHQVFDFEQLNSFEQSKVDEQPKPSNYSCNSSSCAANMQLIESIQILTATVSSVAALFENSSLTTTIDNFIQNINTLSRLS